MNFNQEWMMRFGWPNAETLHLPLAIAHRGASDYRMENTLAAFQLAAELGAEMWELDVRLSKDGVVVVCHDESLERVAGSPLRIPDATWAEISKVELPRNQRVPRLEEVIELARQTNSGLYIELKAAEAAEPTWRILQEQNFQYAVIGSFHADWIAQLRQAKCSYPLSVLIPVGVDPFEYSAVASPDIIHLCWKRASSTPHELVTEELVSRCQQQGMALVTWDEERVEVLRGLDGLPILGTCSDCPEILKPWPRGSQGFPKMVCHRGANFLAPENTLPAASICISQGFDLVEIDVRTTADGEIVLMHDATVDRTTNGKGLVRKLTLEQVRQLDAGSSYSEIYAGTRVPTLDEFLAHCRGRCGAYVEIKDADPDRVLEQVVAHAMLEDVFFWCRKTEVLQRIRNLEPKAQLMATRWMYPSLEAAIAEYQADIVEYELGRDDLTEVARCQALGVRAMAFSLTHDLSKLQQIEALNADLVNLDRPDLFKLLKVYPNRLQR